MRHLIRLAAVAALFATAACAHGPEAPQPPPNYAPLATQAEEQTATVRPDLQPEIKAMQAEFPQYLTSTPLIVSRQVEGDAWGEMGELQVG